MATRFSNALVPDTTVTANMRAWAQFVEDTLVTTGGWVVTGDSGQTLPSTLTATTGANQKKGYRIYRMSDSLQGVAPVFMRVDYGSAIAQGGGMWITIGTGSDGSGNITGILYNGGALSGATCGSAAAALTQASNCYGSAAPNRASIAMCIQNGSSGYTTVFCIERTKDATGADTSAGLLLIYGGGSAEGTTISSVGRSRYIICAGGTQPLMENGLSYILTGQNPSQSFLPGDIGVGVVFHFKGLSQQPGTNILITNSSDVSAEGQIVLTLYNQQRVYQQLNLLYTQLVKAGTSVSDTNARVLMRFD